jgi:hypothetical protein
MGNLAKNIDGDAGFIGIDTKTNPSVLKDGNLQDGKNIRIEQQILQVRKGVARILDASQATTVGTIYGSGVYRLTNGTEKVVLVVSNGLYLFDIGTQALSSKYNFPAGRTITSGPVQVLQAVNKIYILRGEATKYITGDGTSGQNATVSGGGHTVVTVTTILPHGLIAGDEFAIEASHTQWCGPTKTNNFVVATAPTSTSFTYNLTTGHSGSASAYVIQVGKPVLEFDGTTINIVNQGIIDGTILGGTTPTACSFPMTSTAIYHKNRIFCKYSKDEIAVSDYLPNVSGNWDFDLTIQALTVNLGDEQEITGFHPWIKDFILVFKDNSIYTAKFADDTTSPNIVLSSSFVENLTMELGCVAKNSIANVGNMVFFLSKNGVYGLEPQIDANLLANTTPMSIDVQKYVDRINQKFVKNAIGIVYNGRYYLSVPLDNSEVNNYTLIYNLNNKAWESIDTYPSTVNPFNLIVAKNGSTSVVNRLFFCTQVNGIYLAEQKNFDEFGSTLTALTLPFYLPSYLIPTTYEVVNIPAFIKTRRYMMGSIQSKRYSDMTLEVEFGATGALRSEVVSYNPDTRKTIDIVTAGSTTDKSRRIPIRKSSVGLDIELTNLQGRPIIKAIGVTSTQKGFNKTNQE